MTPIDRNKHAVELYVSAFNRGDVAALRELFTKDANIQGVLGDASFDQAAEIWRELHSAFSIELKIESMVADESMVAVRYTETGIFRQPFRGKQPTGKSYTLVAMEWFEMRDGKIARRWGARDSASQVRQLEMA